MSTRIQASGLCMNYPRDPAAGRVGWEIFPAGLEPLLAEKRTDLSGLPYIDSLPGQPLMPSSPVDSLVQLRIRGDRCAGGFMQGHTMRQSPSVDGFRMEGQSRSAEGEASRLTTTLVNGRGHRVEHCVSWHEGDSAVAVETTFFNDSAAPVTLEMLSSFSMGGITPFDAADAPGRLRVHRFRSVWSAEGRLQTDSVEQLHLERSWSGSGGFSERFGQVGTMPVRKWFPFVAVEDTEARVTWGAQFAWAGSWQMEIFRQGDNLCISGGLADREFGHWMKTIPPGGSLKSPPAMVACVRGGLDELCDELTSLQHRAADRHPEIEQDLPVVFNEWCTTWGDPRHGKIEEIADRLQGSGVTYLVIDAGWYKEGDADWCSGHGDWRPSPELFPHGLEAAAAAIRERGLIPGLWFEMETAGARSEAFSRLERHMLHRDGFPLTVGERRFWNLNDPVAIAHLEERVINRLEACGFGYLKVDYNESAGLGADHPDSPGEGLRLQVEASAGLFRKIRSRLPDLVIENCASGGHRLEPSMLALTAMSSFSDAHELPEIPIIAANLHSLILPRQSQIWAVLHPSDSLRRLAYSLSATFLGRMCLSGGVTDLPGGHWEAVRAAIALYRAAVPVIKHGTSRRFGERGESWRYPRGWQAVRRLSAGGDQVLVVLHTFANSPAEVQVPLPEGSWRIAGEFPSPVTGLTGSGLGFRNLADFCGAAVLLERTS